MEKELNIMKMEILNLLVNIHGMKERKEKNIMKMAL